MLSGIHTKRGAIVVLLLAALATPIVFILAGRSVLSNHNDATDWLPRNYAETQQLRWFRQYFVSDQFVVISWEGCRLRADNPLANEDGRIDRLALALDRVEWAPPGGGEAFRCFKSVVTARGVLEGLTSAPSNLSASEAKKRLEGILVGPDGQQTCVVATLSDESVGHMREILGRPRLRPSGWGPEPTLSPLYRSLSLAGIPLEAVHLGGPPIDNISIDEEGEKTLLALAALSGALGVALAWWSLRSIRMTVVVFFCGLLSAALSLAGVTACGGSMDAVLMSMPALVYVLAVSGSIHYVNYYRQEVLAKGFDGATRGAAAHAWKPALLCSATTAIGLLSLCVSDITPIRKFGAYSALGVVATLPVLFGLLPAALSFWPWQPPPPRGIQLPFRKQSKIGGNGGRSYGWESFAKLIQRRYAVVLAGSLGVILLLCAGLPRTTTTVDLLKLFSPEAALIQDYKWFESKLGRLVPLEIVVRFPKASLQEELETAATPRDIVRTYSLLERVEFVSRVERVIEEQFGPNGKDVIGGTMSAATFARALDRRGNERMDWPQRYVADDQLSKSRQDLERSGFLAKDPGTGEELWRITVRVAAFHEIDQAQLVRDLQESVKPCFLAHKKSVQSLVALAGQHGAVPSGSRVAIWAPDGLAGSDHQLAELLANKRVRTVSLQTHWPDTPPETRTKLRELDGVVPGHGVSQRELSDARSAGVALLTPDATGAFEVPQDGSDVGIVFTGVMPIVNKAQRALLDSLIQSTWWSFATITPLMMFVCRSTPGGAVVMLPNVLPVLVVFGGMGWLGIPVDIGAMMAASIALGVAVDDTIHFLAWYREDLHRFGDRGNAVLSAYKRSATPTLQAALVNGLGLSVFAFSAFTPTQRFGWLMLTILGAGVIAELVMLPSLLMSPLGRALDAGKHRESAQRGEDGVATRLASLTRPRVEAHCNTAGSWADGGGNRVGTGRQS